ncbi:1-aminocyclopropane-1-carboxylate deaminase [Leptospira biflexa]|uniref:1-aminocyclopropane-1-carboxylate deaminase n=1 Tax=Leptospira biflexa TaxID=172 RepID=UPI001090D6F3|nr:1-aminocyclopropane-1-carboxylate deaminase [Leptospira biflexa]TGM54282.1 1-aminocyclopropane-1-carboxylate deaminase [Leptospira biflexa]
MCQTKTWHSNGFPNGNIRITKLPHFWMVRDDLLPFGFGTKWRKVMGILSHLHSNQIPKVLLWGAIHGNYLASFTTILRQFGISVETITYSKDPNLRTYNEQLVQSHSETVRCYANRKIAEAEFLETSKHFEGLCLPEFGLHPNLTIGLTSFWLELQAEMERTNHPILERESKAPDANVKTDPPILIPGQNQIQKKKKYPAILVMEIGSGVSFLSAFEFFFDSQIQVLGVMVGEPKKTWLSKVEGIQSKLGMKIRPIPEKQILEMDRHNLDSKASANGTRFGKRKPFHNQWIQNFYETYEILLEPIYSANTVLSLTKWASRENPNLSIAKKSLNSQTPIFYLHQGGQIQHLDLVLRK